MNKDLKNSLKTVAGDVLKLAYNANEDKIKKHLSDAQFRKVRKLANNPESFVKDVVTKKKEQARKYLPIKYDGNFNYTVVSAVYNVEKYLDEYFESLVNQSLNFKKHIHLILVDDGSTDNSAEIIKKWQKKYPHNVTYIYKENGGIASARNMGLQAVTTEWVTFIDSDDKVHLDYFKVIDDVLAKQQNIGLAVGNLHYYYDEDKSIKDTHPLKYRFEKSLNLVPVKELDKNINLFVTVSFFKTKILKDNEIIFDDKIKPNFEDGKFLSDYFLYTDKQNVAYVKDAVFYYRKRSDSSSTIDTAWTKKEKYINVLEYGHLTMLERYYSTYGMVPKNIQNTVLYDFFWYINRLLNKPEKLEFLGDDLKQKFYDLSKKVFLYIDEDTILNFNAVPEFWFFYKVGVLGLFKQSNPKFQICYIENHDSVKNQVLIVVFSHYDVPISYEIGGIDTIPKFYKEITHTFNEQTFVREYRAWVAYDPQCADQKIKVLIGNKTARISLKNQAHKTEFFIENIIQAFKPKSEYQQDGSWLLMDRETKADDNAEHFYRYLKKNHPKQNCYFVLDKTSQDWQRLEDEGFNLVEFGGLSYELHLKKASAIISSHLERPINNYFNDNYDFSKHFIFLQHGVIKDDLSSWINTKKNIDLFVTSTTDEQQSIVGKNSPYRLFNKEVKLLGLPRHDDLLLYNISLEKRILIMPTWRSYIVGKSIGLGVNTRKINDNFMNTSYALAWSSLLSSNELYELINKYTYEVIFVPHPNIEPYLDKFNIPSYIKCLALSEFKNSIQSLFQSSSVLITDYSSVAFEMAYIGKTTLYYQFDQQEFFSGEHTYQKGYFDYEQHGFGAVAETEADLLTALEQVLQNNGEPIEPYATRIRETFPFRDGKCCERVYQAILDLDKPDDGLVDLEILVDMVESAKIHHAWHLVESRCQKQLEVAQLTDIERHQSEQSICQAMYMQGKYAELVNFLETTSLNDDEKAYWQIKLDLWLQKYDEVCTYFTNRPATSNQDKLLALLAYAHKQDDLTFAKVLEGIDAESLSQVEAHILKVIELVLTQDNQAVSELLIGLLNSASENAITWTKDELQTYKPQLILAKALIAQQDYKLCHHYLNRYKEQVANDYACRLIFAQMDFAKGGYKWSVVHYEYLLTIPAKLNQADYTQYLIALCRNGQAKKLADVDVAVILGDERLIVEWVKEYAGQINLSNVEIDNRHQSEQSICQAMYMQGKYAELVNFLETTSLNDDEKAYWQIKLNLWLQKYDEVCAYFINHPATNNQDKLLALLAYAYTQNESAFIEMLDEIDIEALSQVETQMLQVVKFVLTQDNQALSELLVNLLDSESENTIAWTKDELQTYKPQLILAKALIAQEDYKLCHHYLNRYKEQVANDYACRLIFAQMDFAKGGYKWCAVHYESLLALPVQLTQADYTQYLIALCQNGQAKKLADVETEVLLGDERLISEWVKVYANQIDLSNVEINKRHQSEQSICQAMYMQGKYAELVNFLETTSLNDDEKAYWQIKLDLWLQKYDEVCAYFINHPATNNQDKLLALLAYAYTQNESAFTEMLDGIDTESLSQAEIQMLKVIELVLTQDNQALSELLVNLLNPENENAITWTKDELQTYKPQLILAKALIAQEDYKLCHHYLNRYKEQVANDYACRLIFAQMDFAKGGYKWCAVHYESLLALPVQLTQADYTQYLIALCQNGQAKKLADVDVAVILGDEQLLESWIALQVKNQEWQKLDEIFAQNPSLQQSMIYEYALTQYRMGRFEGLDKKLPKPIFGHSYEYWQLMVEIADINSNLGLQKYCYKGMIAIYPERDKERNLQLLNELG